MQETQLQCQLDKYICDKTMPYPQFKYVSKLLMLKHNIVSLHQIIIVLMFLKSWQLLVASLYIYIIFNLYLIFNLTYNIKFVAQNIPTFC